MRCINCNSDNPEGNNFCNSCGHALPLVQNEVKEELVNVDNNTNYQQPFRDPQINNINNNDILKNGLTREENKKANILAGISLACKYGSSIIASLLIGFLKTLADYSGIFTWTLLSIVGIGNIAGFILMLMCRIKYRKNVFGKVVMVLYIIDIVLFILYMIFVIALLAFCAYACQSMGGMY